MDCSWQFSSALMLPVALLSSFLPPGVQVSNGVTVVAAGPAQHSELHVTGAVLVPEANATANAFADFAVLVSAVTDAGKIVIASLAPARPTAALQLVSALKGSKLSFSVNAVGAAAASAAGYTVSITGYTTTGAAAARPATATAAAATPAQAQKRKADEKPAQAQKKQKVDAAAADEDDEEDEEDAPPTPAKKSAPATPATPTSKPTTPSKPTKPSIVTLPNGLKLQDTKIGTGAEAKEKSAVGIRYRGSLASNGKVFDSNMPRGQPLRFKIGGGDVIKGFELGTKGMKVGGTRTVVIPAPLGYGARGAPPDIPGGATLVFDLELVSVK